MVVHVYIVAVVVVTEKYNSVISRTMHPHPAKKLFSAHKTALPCAGMYLYMQVID